MAEQDGHVVDLQQHNGAQTMGSGQNPWMDYFGPPNGPIHTNPYDKFGYTNFDLPDAYRGRNLFLRDTIDGFIMEDNTWYTSVCLPYVRTDEHHFAWNEWHFDTHVVGKVPEEGVSRLIRSSQRSFKESTVRRGIAFLLEHGFMNTSKGREQYLMNLKQIQQSVQETANHDVVAALLTCRRYDHEWEKKHGMFTKSYPQIKRREVSNWAIVQKHTNGLDMIHEEYKQRLKRWNTTPNMWIFPPRLCLYLTMVDPKTTEFYTAGPDGVRRLQQGPAAMTQFRGVNIYETRMFDVYEGDPPIDLLRREQSIGEYNVMRDPFSTLSDSKYAEEAAKSNFTYATSLRDITVYNEEADKWSRISFKKALENWQGDKKEGEGGLQIGADKSTKADYFWQLQNDFFSSATLDRVALTMRRAALKHAGGGGGADGGGAAVGGGSPRSSAAGIRGALSSLGLTSLYLDHPEQQAASAVPLFKLQRASDAGVDVASVSATLDSIGVSANFLHDVVARLESHADKQRFLGGLQGFLGSQDPKAAKNVLSALAKRVPKSNAKLVDYLTSTPCWNAAVDASTVPTVDTWIKTGESWSEARHGGQADLRPGNPATNYTTPAAAGYQATGGWASEPWVASLRAPRSVPRRAAKASRRVDASDLDDLLGEGASAAYIGADFGGVDFDGGEGNDPVSRPHLWPSGNSALDKCKKAFLTMKITAANLSRLASLDILVPFNVVLARNEMTYDMCSAVLMKGGQETGMTAVGHNDFQLGDDVAVKMHYGNYTFKSKAFVQQPRNVIVAENIFAQGYKGGNGVQFRDAKGDGDFHVILSSYEQSDYTSPLSLAGHFQGEEPSKTGPHIQGSDGFIKATNMDNAQDVARAYDDDPEFLERTLDINTVCYQGHQFDCDTQTGKLTVVTRNTGHWGPNVYPGCGAVRMGENQFLEKQAY